MDAVPLREFTVRPPNARGPWTVKAYALGEGPSVDQLRRELEVSFAQQVGCKPSRELGDLVAQALSLVGITAERVSSWIGRPCGCLERKERFNQLSRWAKGVLSGEGEHQDLNDFISAESSTIIGREK